MRVLGPIFHPSPHLAVITSTQVLHGRAVGAQSVRHDALRPAMSFRRFLEKFQCCFAIPHLGGHAFKHLRLMADLDPALMQQVFDVAQRQRKPNGEHHRQANDLRAGTRVAERGALGHAIRRSGCPDRLKKGFSDNASRTAKPASTWPPTLESPPAHLRRCPQRCQAHCLPAPRRHIPSEPRPQADALPVRRARPPRYPRP